MKSFISKDLHLTVLENERIDKVHFTTAGHHYFEVYAHDGRKYGFIATENRLKNGKKEEMRVPLISSLICETVDREDILAANTDTLLMAGSVGNDFTPEEVAFIEQMRVESAANVAAKAATKPSAKLDTTPVQ